MRAARLNAPTGAWCSLTPDHDDIDAKADRSQCTYRCVVLPDTELGDRIHAIGGLSQCTYRCVVLPDDDEASTMTLNLDVSMHLQVRGAP